VERAVVAPHSAGSYRHNIPQLVELAVANNLSMYDSCYLHAAILLNLPLATIDQKLKLAAEACGLATMTA